MGPLISVIFCRSIYICNKNLSPTFLWVLKFDVKLGSWDLSFERLFEKSC